MAVPEGYTSLGLVGLSYKQDYSAETTYSENDLVQANNKIYISLQDNNTGQPLPVAPETETAYWKVWLSGGGDTMDDITAVDTENLTGSGANEVVISQTLIDAIAAKVKVQLSTTDIEQTQSNSADKVPSSNLLNTLITAQSGMIGDAFSEEATYNVGDYCIYQNVLYKFTAEKTAGAWDGTKAEATTVDAEISELTSGSQNMANMSASESYMVLSNKDSTASIAANYSDKKVYIQFPGGNQLTLSGV